MTQAKCVYNFSHSRNSRSILPALENMHSQCIAEMLFSRSTSPTFDDCTSCFILEWQQWFVIILEFEFLGDFLSCAFYCIEYVCNWNANSWSIICRWKDFMSFTWHSFAFFIGRHLCVLHLQWCQFTLMFSILWRFVVALVFLRISSPHKVFSHFFSLLI